jgi:hypothetical protein
MCTLLPTPVSGHGARSLALQMTTDSGTKDPTKVGVIGCGRIGIVHLGATNKAPSVISIVVSSQLYQKPRLESEDIAGINTSCDTTRFTNLINICAPPIVAAAKTFGVPKFTSNAM